MTKQDTTSIDEPNLDNYLDRVAGLNKLAYPDLDGACNICGIHPDSLKALIAAQVQEARIDERNNCWKDFHKSYAVGDKSGDYIILGIEKKIHAHNRKFRVECYWCGGVMFRYSNKFKVKHIMCNCWRDEVKRETRIAELQSTLVDKE